MVSRSHNFHTTNGDSPQSIARMLLKTKRPFLDPDRSFPAKDQCYDVSLPAVVREYPMKIILGKDDCIPSVIDAIIRGNNKHKRNLENLTKALFRLAHTGGVDRQALVDGQQSLPHLIHLISDEEHESKKGINPQEAATLIAVDKALLRPSEGIFEKKSEAESEISWEKIVASITPNDIDSQQIESLASWQDMRFTRAALELTLDVVRKINILLERDPPALGYNVR